MLRSLSNIPPPPPPKTISIHTWPVLGTYTFENVEDLFFPVIVKMWYHSYMLLIPNSMPSRCFPTVYYAGIISNPVLTTFLLFIKVWFPNMIECQKYLSFFKRLRFLGPNPGYYSVEMSLCSGFGIYGKLSGESDAANTGPTIGALELLN